MPRGFERDPLYRRIAGAFERQIRAGVLRPGDRLPSVRSLSRRQGVSVFTVVQAYMWLERLGCVESRPRSGFVARLPPDARAPEPAAVTPARTPIAVGLADEVSRVLTNSERGLVPLGTATIAAARLPVRQVNMLIRRVLQTAPDHATEYLPSAGAEVLRRHIARHALSFGCAFPAEEIVITVGAMEALHLSLRAVTNPGDVVAVESPTYFGILQAIEALGLKVVELPTHPRLGPDLDALESAIVKHRVKACVVTPICHNPLGYVLDDDAKRALVEVAGRHSIVLIEDDVYGELAFGSRRPRPAKAFDADGRVLLCSSFSKTVSPGLRLGWVQAGRLTSRIERLKNLSTGATPTLPQLAVARFLETGSYFRHLRQLRSWLEGQVQVYASAVAQTFPPGVRVSRPAGGHVLWIQLSDDCDGDRVYAEALRHNISIVPGSLFAASGAYRNCIRLNCGHPWSPSIARALKTLGRIVRELV